MDGTIIGNLNFGFDMSIKRLNSISFSLNTHYLHFSLASLLSSLSADQPLWRCPPENGSFFASSPCDPNAPFGCPPSYKCRMALEDSTAPGDEAAGGQKGPVDVLRERRDGHSRM